MSEQNDPKRGVSGPHNNNQQNGKRPITASIIYIVLGFAIAFFFANQFFGVGTSERVDTLTTSDFVQAIEQGRVASITYDAGEYSVSGSYYPLESQDKAAEEEQEQSARSSAIASLFGFGNNNQQSSTNGTEDTGSTEVIAASPEDNVKSSTNANGELQVSKTLRRYTSTFVGQDALLELIQGHPEITYEITLPSGWTSLLTSLLPIILIGVLFFFFISQMNKANNSQMNFGKTKARKNTSEMPDVRFDDVAGVDEAVEEMREIKDFLSHPERYEEMGAKVPRGCLLVGPPGTGKTLLARAVAGEAGVPFFSISGSDFVEMFVGVGASRVRDLFKQAKAESPSIIFIDEIDAVGRQRGTGLGGGHDEREQTLNQLLVEMDGFEKNDAVILIAATNRADVLDPALLRPGRFDRQIVVDTPDVRGREQILNVHAKEKPLADNVDLKRIAQLTPGFTGADLMNLMNESALMAARKRESLITMDDVTESMERVIAGPERKGRIIDDQTKRTIAFHESGHALVGHLLPYADPVHKISIISRGRALGYTLSIPKEDKVLNSRNEMLDELAVFMGGRVAEEVFCNDITTGASNDLERATKMARAMVTQYGMSQALGTQIFGQPNHEVFLGRDYGNTQDYSEETARRIDVEVSRIMKEAHDRAYEILVAHQQQMTVMAGVLLERETIDGDACQALLNNQWDEYLQAEAEEQARVAREQAVKAALAKQSSSRDSAPEEETDDDDDFEDRDDVYYAADDEERSRVGDAYNQERAGGSRGQTYEQNRIYPQHQRGDSDDYGRN